MGKLIEVIRRLSLVIVCVAGGFLGIAQLFDGYRNDNLKEMFAGIVFLMITYVIHRVINWILLREEKLFADEKNAPPGNE